MQIYQEQHIEAIKNNELASTPTRQQAQLILEHNLELQGSKKVIEYTFLQASLLKIIFLGIPLILSIIGLYFLAKYRNFRIKIFYNSQNVFCAQRTTHIHVKTNDSTREIAKISKQQFGGQSHYTFKSNLLKYQIIDSKVCPVGSRQIQRVLVFLNISDKMKMGLTNEQYVERMSFYGPNDHNVEIPGYLFYVCQIMTEPLFILQYCIFGVWIIRQLFINVTANFIFCIVVTTVNYIILYNNFSKIKRMAERQFTVKALRGNQYCQIKNSDIVPGDIYLIQNQIPCDSVLLMGDMMVNEVNFTGQNLPIIKTKLQNISQFVTTAHWIYQGSEIITVKPQTIAIAIHTGYTSHRGRIIRKIIKHNVKEPDFTQNILLFFVLAYILAALIYFSYIIKLTSLPIREDTIVFLFFQIVSLAVPVGYIGVLSFFPGMSLIRLDSKEIYGKQPYKVYESAQIRTICFDKTGTLTKRSIQLGDIYSCNTKGHTKVTEMLTNQPIIKALFASCHVVKQVGQQTLKGDEIDLKMFQNSNAKLLQTCSGKTLWQIQCGNEILEVLRVNQFQSKHMSMSVLVREKSSKHMYVFVKGSPELIHKFSISKCQSLPDLVKQLSFEGFRTIGFGFKRIQESSLQQYIYADRGKYIEEIQMLGVVSFVNKLKEETREVIQRLRFEVGLNVKMITGDNIYTAVQAGFKAGIISQNETVIVCQGRNIVDDDSKKKKVVIIWKQNGEFHQKQETIDFFNSNLFCSINQSTTFAIEGALLDESIYELQILNKIKIFARVSPQNKTQIIKRMQNLLQVQYNQKGNYQKLFGNFRTNVCMVGDGANDLMAIKQADVGIGLSQSDGTFSADFVVSRLCQIQQIICQGKSISRIAIETLIIFFINTWLYIPLMLLTLHDLCTFSEETMFYKNVAFAIFMPLMFGLTKPSSQNTKHFPQMNILSFQNQVNIWVNNFIFTGAFYASFYYYWRSDDFEVNNRGWVTMKDSFTTFSKSSTLCFKLILAHCISVIFNLYQSRPWKQTMNKNILLTAWMIINILADLLGYFRQEYLGFMKLAPMSNSVSSMVLIFMAVAFLLSSTFVNLLNQYYTITPQKPYPAQEISTLQI